MKLTKTNKHESLASIELGKRIKRKLKVYFYLLHLLLHNLAALPVTLLIVKANHILILYHC